MYASKHTHTHLVECVERDFKHSVVGRAESDHSIAEGVGRGCVYYGQHHGADGPLQQVH